MLFADLCWPAVYDYRGLDPGMYGSILAELSNARDRLVRRHRELLEREVGGDSVRSSHFDASDIDGFSTVIVVLDRSLSTPADSDEARVLDVARIFAELDNIHVGDVRAKYRADMAEYDEDDELDDDAPDLSERAWEIGRVPPGRFHGLMVIAAALVAPQIANPDDCVARMGEIVAGRTLELAELADADDGRSARRFEALEREVQALAAALSSGVSVVDTIARVLEVVGPLRWRHCANDLRLEYVGDGWGDESDWQADAARYELMTSVEGALRLR